MTACCTHDDLFARGGKTFAGAEVTLAQMISRGTYTVVSLIEAMHRRWTERTRTEQTLHTLRGLDDRHLADIGLGRDDLTEDGLAEAAARRDLAAALLRLRR